MKKVWIAAVVQNHTTPFPEDKRGVFLLYIVSNDKLLEFNLNAKYNFIQIMLLNQLCLQQWQ